MHKAGSGAETDGMVQRVLALEPGDFSISGLRNTGADRAGAYAHDEGSVEVIRTALSREGFEVSSTPVWNRYVLTIPTALCRMERSDVVKCLEIRNRRHGFPQDSLSHYVWSAPAGREKLVLRRTPSGTGYGWTPHRRQRFTSGRNPCYWTLCRVRSA